MNKPCINLFDKKCSHKKYPKQKDAEPSQELIIWLYGVSGATLFEIFPIDSISLSIKSPTAKNSAGLRCIPTPAGVPVKITSPGFNVMHLKIDSLNIIKNLEVTRVM